MTPGSGAGGGRGTTAQAPRHIPVLLAEVVAALNPRDGGVCLDGTFGAGGYARAILQAARCRVIALDRDPAAIAGGRGLQQEFGDRLTLIQGRFGELEEVSDLWSDTVSRALRAAVSDQRSDISPLLDGVVLDVGVSSMQIDEAGRGFSFMADGPLDMRMGADGETAADVVARASETELAAIIFHLGEERQARRIARFIVKAREAAPITRTRQLADIVSRAVGGRQGAPIHPATRTFQALRIHVNDELEELARGLAAAERTLKPGGRLVVVTFHSLEDRIVKRFLAARAGRASHGSRHLPPESVELRPPSFRIVNPKPLTPGKGEQDANPRARSARLRAAERTDAPAWPLDPGEVGVPLVTG